MNATDTKPLALTDADFDATVGSSDVPVLVDFWATWCPPCLMLAPTIERLAAEAEGRFVVAKLEADKHPEATAAYGVSALPTVLIFREGEVVARIIGPQPVATYEKALAAAAG